MNPAPFSKLLILGLDALPWSVAGPLMDSGAMPWLRALCAAGCAGNLRSTIPHQTPSAWTTFMTGVQPGVHGILNWHHYDALSHRVGMNDTRRFEGRTVYHLFSEAGLRVGVVLQPVTYPPFALNGFLLSGFDSPGVSAPFASPRELEREILELCPNHAENLDLDGRWEAARHEADDAVFERNIALLSERVAREAKLAAELYRRHPLDVLMVYFQDTDLILHRAWRWCAPGAAADAPRRWAAVRGFFQALDDACRELHALTADSGRLTLLLSDHGQRPDATRVRLNSILMELGFLVPASGLGLVKAGLRRLTGLGPRDRARSVGLPVDWARTRAFMPYQSCTGFIYVNLKGRQPLGSVPREQFLAVRDALIAALRGYRDRQTGANYFDEIAAMDEDSGWKRDLNLPDIYVQPRAGVEFVRRARAGEISFPTKRPYAGLHDPDGMYILHGRGVKHAEDVHAHIVDMAPTLLAALGVSVPSFMQGRVRNEAFEAPLPVESRQMTWEAGAHTAAYTAAEAAAVEQRLADLGYLD